jgi:hypothetical protein
VLQKAARRSCKGELQMCISGVAKAIFRSYKPLAAVLQTVSDGATKVACRSYKGCSSELQMDIGGAANKQRRRCKYSVILLLYYKFCATISLASLRRNLRWMIFCFLFLGEPFFRCINEIKEKDFFCDETKSERVTTLFLFLVCFNKAKAEGFLLQRSKV